MEVITQHELTKSFTQIFLSLVSLLIFINNSIRGKIYVIGGDYEMSCEVYDLKENKWSFISSYNSLLGNSLYSFSSAMAVQE